jgi:hypothetical protein
MRKMSVQSVERFSVFRPPLERLMSMVWEVIVFVKEFVAIIKTFMR